jgi:CRISPR-associated protein (TIGR02584 family)
MRNILIITAGATPQIVTETVWALLKREPQFAPAAIHLVTTAHGRQVFARELLGADGRLAALFRCCGVEPVEPEIHLPQADSGGELADIRTAEECAAYANTVSRLIMRYAANPDTRIHVSLAGGRKTMSYFAGAAISLFGRDQDELSHVLIEPEHFEQCLDFWHPGQPEGEVHHRNGRDVHNPADAHVGIAYIPFLRLSHALPDGAFTGGKLDYRDVLQHLQESLDARQVRLIPSTRTLAVGPYEVTLRHREFALYRLVAAARLEGWPGAGPDGLGPEHRGWITYDQLLDLGGPTLRRFFECYDEVYRSGTEETENFREFAHIKLAAGLRNEVREPFMQTLAKLNNQIEAKIANPSIRARVRIASAGRNPKRFGLALAPEEIEIDDSWA